MSRIYQAPLTSECPQTGQSARLDRGDEQLACEIVRARRGPAIAGAQERVLDVAGSVAATRGVRAIHVAATDRAAGAVDEFGDAAGLATVCVCVVFWCVVGFGVCEHEQRARRDV